MNSFSISKRFALGAAAFLAVLAPTILANTQEDDREIRTRDRQTYEVIVGDYYTGRSPYFKSLGEPAPKPMVVAQAATAAKPAAGRSRRSPEVWSSSRRPLLPKLPSVSRTPTT